ncbi:hypothetical protein AMTRI_Chr08g207060 [Amborella trichopoda]|uniref:elongator complex protein 6 n=1 Tax=Amborella trichopoda TaxID=13333 RepID=UPI0005D426FE|nr:elongator complex protein 6 [Amborella trichopoda]XP_020529710.1 elongator complex protein 6 [Amborella trichopoda]|eukprot:XP_011627333.1 elongator complex protein 6 [Amborella trichopoda]
MGTLLDQALGLQTTNQALPRGKVFLIKDGVRCHGSFVLHHLLTRALPSSLVLFLALAEPFSHYDRILKKLGCNLTAQRENNKFLFFDLLQLGSPGVERESLVEGGLFELYGKIHKVVELNAASNGNGNICIMIDDVSLLEIAARGFLDSVLNFLHYCHALTSVQGCSLVLLGHEDIYSNMPHPRFLFQIEYFADVMISVKPLATGLSADVHGQLTVLNKGSFDEQSLSKNKICNFQFRIKENSVEYFYPGAKI